MDKIFKVSEVNERIKNIFDNNFLLSNIHISGQVSNYKKHSSGHHYFSLKDADGVISAVMFKFDAVNISFELKDGLQVIAFGRVSSFVKTGQYQLYVKQIICDGIGDLHIEFDKLKKKLYEQGLFDEENKLELPRLPSKIAIVTAKTGAAILDMQTILKNRFPIAEILIYSVLVQGEGACEQIAYAINYINNKNLADVIIIGRGGGSIEDLWAFNSEELAHTIYASNIPIISAVGHEPDFTISDFVADVRASTPSNAAEIAVPDISAVKSFLNTAQSEMNSILKDKIHNYKIVTKSLSNRIISPQNYILEKRLYIDYLVSKLKNPKILIEINRNQIREKSLILNSIYTNKIVKNRQKTIEYMAYVDGFSPLKVLGRGYGYSIDSNDKIIKSVKKLKKDEEISTKYADGIVKSKILEIEVE